MRSRKSPDYVTILFPLICLSFLSASTACGWSYSPTPVPAWAAKKLDIPGARVFYGGLNATITQTVHPTDEKVEFAFISKGEMNSESGPFAQATRLRFNLYSRDGTLLCGNEKFEDWVDSNPWYRPLSAASKVTKECKLSDDYLKPPLRGTLEFRYSTGDREDQMVPELTVETSYYIVSDSKPCKEVDPETHKCK